MKNRIHAFARQTILATGIFFLSWGLAHAQAVDYLSAGGSIPDSPEPPQGIPSACTGGEIHDDGVAENGYGWNSGTVSDGRFSERFSPSINFTYTEVCFCWVGLSDATIDFEIEAYDNSGAGGSPGVLLGSVPAQATAVPNAIPGGWYSFDISSMNLDVSAGDTVYIGARWNPMTEQSFFICSDESGTTPINGGYAYNNNEPAWTPIQNVGLFANYRSMLIRANGEESVNTSTRATFAVTKDFSDNNPSEVTVSIDCNTGLILDQDKDIAEGDGVEFVVTEFTEGTLNCEITEQVPAGYEASYFDGAATSSTSCEFTGIEDGDAFTCAITNDPLPVNVEVTKNWVIEGDNNDVFLGYRLDLDCNEGEIVGQDYVVSEGPTTKKHIFKVIPDYPSTSCAVFEEFYDSGIEVTNGCGRGNVVVAAGRPVSCTITNTVFFEGIPSLNQYGMAILALLMLGVGLVGFRRLV